MKRQSELPQGFADLGIEVRFLKALAKMQFHEPTDIQQALIPQLAQRVSGIVGVHSQTNVAGRAQLQGYLMFA